VTTELPKDATIAALADEFAAIDDLLAELAAEQWKVPTELPGWDVQANVAHIIGTEKMLAGIAAPEVGIDVGNLDHVRNDIGKMNEPWIVGLADVAPDEMRAQLREIGGQRVAALEEMSEEAWHAEGFTPAGKDSHGRFMRIRVFDCWMHEHDIRAALDLPPRLEGAPVDLVLDEMSTAVGFVVGKKAGAPDGTAVTFQLTGPGGRDLHVLVDGRAALVPTLDRPADVTITTDVHTFTRLAGGRARWSEIDQSRVTIDGDEALGTRILDNLAFTI
jgi:uncharacterized protein (TIGR03083 family)